MPWKYSEQTTAGASASTVTAALPPHYTGLFLLALMSNDVGTSAITAPAGWTPIGVQANIGGCRGAAFYKFATSGAEADPVFTGSTGTWAVSVSAWADVDATTPIDATPVRQDWNNVQYASSAAYTTATDNAVAIYLWNSDGASAMTHPIEDVTFLAKDRDNGSTVMTCGYRNVITAGAAPTVRMLHTVATEGGSCLTFALRNSSGGKLGPCIAPGFAETIGHYFGAVGHTWLDPLSVVASINGIACEATSQTITTTVISTDPWGTYSGWTSSAANVWAGGIHSTGTTYDGTNKIFSVSWTISANNANASFGADGVIAVFFDTSGNYVAYQLRAKTYCTLANVGFVSHIALGVTTPYATSGTINWTQIDRIGYLYHRVGAVSYILRVKGAMLHPRTATFHGGCDASPITAASYAAQWTQWGYEGRANNPPGSGQVIDKQPIGIGNGSTDCHLDFSTQSVETPLPYSTTARRVDFNVPANASGYTINLTAASKAYLRNCILVANTGQFFTVDPSCSTSADLQLTASTLRGFAITWKSGVSAGNAAIDACPSVDLKGGFWDSMTITGGSGTQAILVDSGAKLTNCRFIRGTETYAITARQSGTLDLTNASDDTFSGYTTPINITAAAGTLTIKLALGQTQPTYVTAGATVAWDQPVVSATGSVTGMIAGGRLQIYNETTATEMVNAVQAGTSYSTTYPNGTGYTDGDAIRIRFRKYGYEPIEVVTVATTGGWSALLSPAVDVHTSGSLPSNYSVDYANKKIRATGTRDEFTAQEIIDIISDAEATATGITLSDFAEITGLVELSSGVFTALTVNLLDWQVSWAAGSVSQAFLSGGNIVGGIAGDPVEDVVGGPQVTIQLAQAGTVVTAGGTVAPSESDIKTWVREELAAEMARIDVAVSSRNATAPDNASISAIKAKTDALTFTVAGQLDVNVQYVNDVQVKGVGTDADPWNPA